MSQNQNQTTSSSNNNQQTQTQQTAAAAQTSQFQSKEIESFIESNWITIKDRETKVLEFVPGKAKVVDKKDFNGKPVKKVQFVVIDINDIERKEKYFEVSRMHVAKIYDELKNGKTILEISRMGQNKDTRYFVKPVR